MGLKVDVNFQLSTWNDEKRESLKLWFQKNKKKHFLLERMNNRMKVKKVFKSNTIKG